MTDERSDEAIGFQIGSDRVAYGVSRPDLDAMGERSVRDALNSGKWGHAGLAPFAFVSAWLADKDFVRIEETNATAKAACAAATAAALSASEANDIARSVKKYAVIAAIAAVIAAISAIKWE